MNSHQRRKWMAEKHMRMPLGSQVIVRGQYKAEVVKHDRQSPHKCIVQRADNGRGEWVSIAQIKPVVRMKVRPWWRVMNDKTRNRGVA